MSIEVITPTSGMPGMRGLDHIGITVPNIKEAVDFFVDIIGCTAFYEMGPFSFDDDWMERQLNVHPRTQLNRLRFLRCGHGSNFELFEYEAPDQKKELPKNSDHGGHHLAFYVDDLDAAIAHLKKNGVRVLGDPIQRDGGPSAGLRWIYFLTPWGLQCELVCFPNGKAYESETDERLWDVRSPQD